MPASVYHVFTSPIADGTNTQLVRPSNWNDAHQVSVSLASNEAIKYVSAGTNQVSSGTVVFGSSAGNVTFGMDPSGYITASAAGGAQSTQPVAYSAANGSQNFSTLVFANSNGVSFSSGTQGLYATVKTDYQAAGAYLTTAMQSNAATISNIMVSAGTTSSNQSSIGFSNANGLSFGFSGASITGSYTVPNVPAQTAFVFSNSNGVTFGTNASTVTASFSAPPAQTVQPGIQAIGGGTVTATTGTLVFSNSNGISFGIGSGASTSQMTASHNGLVNATVFSNSNNVSFGLNGSTVTATATFAGGGGAAISAGANSQSTGTVNFSNANGVTFGLSNNGVMTASVAAAGGAQTGISGIIAGTQTITQGTLSFINSNGVTFGIGSGASTSQFTATVATNYQSQGAYLTTARASNDAIGLNTALTANGVSVTANSSGLSINFPAFLTTAAQSSVSNVSAIYAATNNTGGGSATLSGGVSFTNANSMTFYTSAGGAVAASFSYTNPSVTQYFSNTATTFAGTNISGSMTMNTAGLNLALSVAAPGGGGGIAGAGGGLTQATGTINFANSNNITFGLSNNGTMTASFSQTNQTGNLYVTANSTQLSSTAGIDLRSMSFAGAGIASVGVSAGVIVVSVPSGGGAGDGGNTLAVAGSTAGSNSLVLFSNSPTVTFGMAGNTITASAAGGVGGGVTLNNWRILELNNATSFSSLGQNSAHLQHFQPEAVLQFSNIEIYGRGTFVSSSNSKVYQHTINYGIYSQDTGTNNTRMTLMGSSHMVQGASYNSSSAYGFTVSQGAASYTVSSNSALATNISGAFHQYMPFTTTLQPNVKYAIGMLISSATTVATGPWALGVMVLSALSSNMGRIYATSTNAASSTVIGDREMGIYGTTTAALPNSYATSQLGIASNRANIYIQFE